MILRITCNFVDLICLHNPYSISQKSEIVETRRYAEKRACNVDNRAYTQASWFAIRRPASKVIILCVDCDMLT